MFEQREASPSSVLQLQSVERRRYRPAPIPSTVLASMIHLHNIPCVPIPAVVSIEQVLVKERIQREVEATAQIARIMEEKRRAAAAARDAAANFHLPPYFDNPYEGVLRGDRTPTEGPAVVLAPVSPSSLRGNEKRPSAVGESAGDAKKMGGATEGSATPRSPPTVAQQKEAAGGAAAAKGECCSMGKRRQRTSPTRPPSPPKMFTRCDLAGRPSSYSSYSLLVGRAPPFSHVLPVIPKPQEGSSSSAAAADVVSPSTLGSDGEPAGSSSGKAGAAAAKSQPTAGGGEGSSGEKVHAKKRHAALRVSSHRKNFATPKKKVSDSGRVYRDDCQQTNLHVTVLAAADGAASQLPPPHPPHREVPSLLLSASGRHLQRQSRPRMFCVTSAGTSRTAVCDTAALLRRAAGAAAGAAGQDGKGDGSGRLLVLQWEDAGSAGAPDPQPVLLPAQVTSTQAIAVGRAPHVPTAAFSARLARRGPAGFARSLDEKKAGEGAAPALVPLGQLRRFPFEASL